MSLWRKVKREIGLRHLPTVFSLTRSKRYA